MLRKALILLFSLFISHSSLLAHGSWLQHAEDMYNVFGFERNEELTKWMKFVSSVLIDNNNADCAFSDNQEPFNFYRYLQEKYPGFQCKHRLLFHWGYNSRPWTIYLQNKVEYYGWSKIMIRDFQADLIAEQKRRNGFANEYTENVFGFRHGGNEARIARVFISIAYDVHLLGDYEPDNSDLDGLQDLGSVIGDVIHNLQALDKQQSADLVKKLKKASQGQENDIQEMASLILNILKADFRNVLQRAEDGKVSKHLLAQGFRLENMSSSSPRIDEKKTQKEMPKAKEKRTRTRGNNGIGVIVFIGLVVLGILLVLLFKKHK